MTGVIIEKRNSNLKKFKWHSSVREIKGSSLGFERTLSTVVPATALHSLSINHVYDTIDEASRSGYTATWYTARVVVDSLPSRSDSRDAEQGGASAEAGVEGMATTMAETRV